MSTDKILIVRVCVLLSVIGIFLIGLSSYMVKAKEVRIEDLGKEMLGEHVRVKGKITEKNVHESTLFLEVSDGSEKITAVKFNYENESYNKKEVHLSGRVSLYQGELEIIIEKFL